MKNLNKINRENLKSINGGAQICNNACPPGPYGPGLPRSCEAFMLCLHAVNQKWLSLV